MNPVASIRPVIGLTALAAAMALLASSCSREDASPVEVEEAVSVEVSEASAPDPAPSDPAPSEAAPAEGGAAADPGSSPETMKESPESETAAVAAENREVTTLGGGCFWCVEAVMLRLDGVVSAVSGYMGGHVENPTYEQVVSKTTGHAEVVQVTFDNSVITFEEILDIFWQAHDPTTLNRQGNDIGPQYRSAIFYHTPEQKRIAESSMRALDESGYYSSPAVTEITEASTFWEAEEEHQNYYSLNKDKNPYCRIVITPKLEKLGLE